MPNRSYNDSVQHASRRWYVVYLGWVMEPRRS